MRKYILPAALAAMMTLAPIASASPGQAPAHPAESQTSAHFAKLRGVIHSIDTKANAVTLDDGRTFVLPASASASSLKAGEKVKLEWSWIGDQRVAREVTTLN
jgi:Cu/Ag efflux protein CusF